MDSALAVLLEMWASTEGKALEYVIHEHRPRNGSRHFDLRVRRPDSKELLSFAFGRQFLDDVGAKTVGVRTKDHPEHWLSIQSHRLRDIERGWLTMEKFSESYIEFTAKGWHLRGKYKLFKLETHRNDNWLLVKTGDV